MHDHNAPRDERPAWEARWLEYSRRVVSDTGHREACRARGGSPTDPRLRPEVRWPGYAGARYRPGGMLWVNIVHRNMDIDGYTPLAIAQLAEATAAWSVNDISDDEYLAANRSGYMTGFDDGGWYVGRDLRRLTEA